MSLGSPSSCVHKWTWECAAFITIKTRGADLHMYGVCARAILPMNIRTLNIHVIYIVFWLNKRIYIFPLDSIKYIRAISNFWSCHVTNIFFIKNVIHRFFIAPLIRRMWSTNRFDRGNSYTISAFLSSKNSFFSAKYTGNHLHLHCCISLYKPTSMQQHFDGSRRSLI